jgi:hypothetical protein
MTREQADQIAITKVKRLEDVFWAPLAVMWGSTVETKSGWVYFYNSKVYVDTNNDDFALLGNGPVVVFLDGSSESYDSTCDIDALIESLGKGNEGGALE